MRDLVIVLVYAAALGYALWKRNAFIAILVFFWISFMNPHRYSWGFAYSLPLAMGSVAITFATMALQFNQLKWPRTRELYFFFLLWLFITITTIFSMYPPWAWEKWSIVNKILLMTFVSMLIINTKNRIIIFLFAIILFIGSVGIKGAVFGFLTGGKYKVWGPPESFLEDNNGLGLCMVMLLPLSLFLKDLFTKKWLRWGMLGIAGGLAVSAVLTYSRGALVGLVMVFLYYFLFAKHKLRIAILGIVIGATAFSVLPKEWFDRMTTIGDYQEDESANMRLNSWQMAVNLALENPLGGGFNCFTRENYQKYAPNPDLGFSGSNPDEIFGSTAHSVYFELIAMHGFGGLAVYLVAVFSLLFSLLRLDKIGKSLPGEEWISYVSRGLIGSMIGFLTSGAFLTLAFFDLFWAIFGAGVCLKSVVMSGSWLEESPQYEEVDAVTTPELQHEDSVQFEN
ncbi:putative O-glycosylation ligase, exosortase A system-associated [candidate division KSB1 bacterium]|nr:putative O-glycosylation ligase, exosortase A system-associated [candidate division KSB1 bacterium]